MNITFAWVSFCAGLFPLWIMFRLWQKAKTLLDGAAFTYFLTQHVAFGLGGLLMSLFDDGYKFINLQGEYLYADGLQRLLIINLGALYAALFGVYSIDIVRRTLSMRSRANLLGNGKNNHSKLLTVRQQVSRRIAYLSLGIHVSVVLIQWYSTYHNLGATITYIVQIFAKVSPAAFFFMGMRWSKSAKYDRRIFLIYLVSFGVLQLSTGGRAPILYASLIFFIGILSDCPEWFLRRRLIVLIISSIIILPWFAIQSENVRLLTRSRIPENLEDVVQRLQILVLAEETPKEDSWGYKYTPSLSNSLFRFGARIVEVSALDVLAKTPEDIPYYGWSSEDFVALLHGLLPAALMFESSVQQNGAVTILRDYGWAVDPVGGTSFPMTLLADSYRRFGWYGVIAIHFLWAVLLTMIPPVLGRQRTKQFGIVIAGPILYIIAFSYTNDLVTILATLPRLLCVSGVYAILLCVIAASLSWRRKVGSSHRNSLAL